MKEPLAIIPLNNIRTLIYTIRGEQVMLDSDLAEIYGVETKVFNRAVKRNSERFPSAFCFQITQEEYDNLRCQIGTSSSDDSLRSQIGTLKEDDNLRSQIVTSSHGGRRYLPYAFTEQGVSMLSAVLRSETAIKVSIQIINAFVEMRRFLQGSASVFARLDSVEKRQLAFESKTAENFEKVFQALEAAESPRQGIFYDGQVHDAHAFVSDLIRAKLAVPPPALDPAPAALFPEHLEDSPRGHIPKGWKVGRIQDCCVQIQNGGTPRRNEPRFWDSGNIPWLASGALRQSIITATESFITEEGLAESSAKWVPPFSTVVALYGATAGQVSLTSCRLTTNQAVCALIPKKDFAFFNYLTMRQATAELENKAVGSAQQNISKGIVEETKVVIPPPALVERFAATACPLFERWISNLHQSSTLTTLRDTLLPKLLNGELIPENYV